MFTFLATRIIGRLQRLLTAKKRTRYEYLSIFAAKLGAKKIMEIGTNKGNSAMLMIQAAIGKAKDPKEIYYYGFDLFELLDDSIFQKEVAKRSLPMNEVSETLKVTGANIKLYRGFTRDIFPEVIGDLPKMDLIFIDGGHTVETITTDWEYSRTLMHKHTVVIFDDYWPDGFNGDLNLGCKKVIEAIDKRHYSVEILPRADVIKKDWGDLSIYLVKVTKAQVNKT